MYHQVPYHLYTQANPIGWLAMAFWGVVIALVFVLFFRWIAMHSWTTHRTEDSAMHILKERYARGEIKQDEFEQKKKDLLS